VNRLDVKLDEEDYGDDIVLAVDLQASRSPTEETGYDANGRFNADTSRST
jgi:hypothetical protein